MNRDIMSDENSVAEAIKALALHVRYLGNGSSDNSMGAIEFLGTQIKEAVADAISAYQEQKADEKVEEVYRTVNVVLEAKRDLVTALNGICIGLESVARAIRER